MALLLDESEINMINIILKENTIEEVEMDRPIVGGCPGGCGNECANSCRSTCEGSCAQGCIGHGSYPY